MFSLEGSFTFLTQKCLQFSLQLGYRHAVPRSAGRGPEAWWQKEYWQAARTGCISKLGFTHSHTLAHLSHLHTQLHPAWPLPFVCLWRSPSFHIFILHRSCNIQQPHPAVKPPLSTSPCPESLLQHLPPVGLWLLRFLRTYTIAAQISVSRSSAAM